MSRRVLYISYDGMTDNLGQSQVIPYLKGLSELGYSFTLLSCEKPENYTNNKTLIQELLNESKIEWIPLMYHKSPPILSTAFDLYKIQTKAISLYNELKFDIVHCRSYLPSLVGLRLKKKYGVKFIFDMRGFWADERIDGNLWNIKNPIYKLIYNIFKRREKSFLQESDYIISLTQNGKKIISSGELGYQVNTPIQVVPCCVDLDLFNIKERKKIKGEFILSYIGSIGTWYMLDEMLDFFKILNTIKTNAKFLFITREPKQYVLDRCIAKKIDVNSIIIKSAERNEVPAYIAQSDASIFFIKPVFSKRASSPTKQGEIMAMGVPIICNTKVGDTEYVVEKYNSGILINSFVLSAYKKAIDELLNLDFKSADIRNGAQDFYSLTRGIENYDAVYKKCLV